MSRQELFENISAELGTLFILQSAKRITFDNHFPLREHISNLAAIMSATQEKQLAEDLRTLASLEKFTTENAIENLGAKVKEAKDALAIWCKRD